MKRILYLDILKGFSILFVVMLHVSGPCVTHEPLGSSNWWIGNIYDSSCRFVVPVFVMVSGALFLNPDKPFKMLHSVKRLLIPLILWSSIYAALVVLFRRGTIAEFLEVTFVTPTHNWFLYMLIGVYLCVPFLKRIIEDEKLENSFLVLWMIFGLFLPLTKNISGLEVINNTFLGRMCMSFPLGYTGYFVLGHKLANLKRVSNGILLPLFGASVIVIAIGTFYLSAPRGSLSEVFYEYLNPFVALSAGSFFLVVKNICNKIQQSIDTQDVASDGKLLSLISVMSKYSLAIYMLHMIIYIVLQKFGLWYDVINPALCIPIFSIIIYSISFLCVFILDKVPVLKKYLL